MKRSNSSDSNPNNIPALSVGFCTNKAAEAILVAAGVNPDRIYRAGRGVESIDRAMAADRGRGLTLYVAEPLTMFGQTRKDILGQTSAFARRQIPLRDVRFPDAMVPDLEHDALRSLSAKNGMKDSRTARKRARLGGLAKKAAAEAKRQQLDRDGVMLRLFNHPEIKFRVAMQVAGPTTSPSSARRYFCKPKI